MNRSERRYRTWKKAIKRFRFLYCGFHGTPEQWFFRANKKTQEKRFGQCRDRAYSWRCRCDYCLGKIFRNQSISDLNFRDQLLECISDKNKILMAIPNVLDESSVGPFTSESEIWQIRVCPWKHNSSDEFHHK